MIYDDKHLFVALPKCGSSFVQLYLDREYHWRYAPHAPFGSWHHRPICLAPESLWEGRSTFAVIRNPWAWYRSLYHAERKAKIARWEQGKHSDFASWLALVLDGKDHPHLVMHHRLDIDLFSLMAFWGCGILTLNYLFQCAENPGPIIRRTGSLETLEIAVNKFLKLECIVDDLSEYLHIDRERLAKEPRANVSTEGHYFQNYTPELTALVASRDQLIVKRFGYHFESETP